MKSSKLLKKSSDVDGNRVGAALKHQSPFDESSCYEMVKTLTSHCLDNKATAAQKQPSATFDVNCGGLAHANSQQQFLNHNLQSHQKLLHFPNNSSLSKQVMEVNSSAARLGGPFASS